MRDVALSISKLIRSCELQVVACDSPVASERNQSTLRGQAELEARSAEPSQGKFLGEG